MGPLYSWRSLTCKNKRRQGTARCFIAPRPPNPPPPALLTWAWCWLLALDLQLPIRIDAEFAIDREKERLLCGALQDELDLVEC